MQSNEDLTMFIEEAVRIELNVADLYLLFNRLFGTAYPADGTFWWDLALEEKNHAALIRSAEMLMEALEGFPSDLLPHSMQVLKITNGGIRALIEKYTHEPPSRAEAFSTAYSLENSAGEIHFQNFMSKGFSSEMEELFQKLNKEDRDHAARIEAYMEKNGIEKITQH